MSSTGSTQRAVLDQQIRELETRTVESLATVRLLKEQWEEYRFVMSSNTMRFEESSERMGATNYFVQRGLAARRELNSHVTQLARQQEEFLDETDREIRSVSETEMERLDQEKVSASWD